MNERFGMRRGAKLAAIAAAAVAAGGLAAYASLDASAASGNTTNTESVQVTQVTSTPPATGAFVTDTNNAASVTFKASGTGTDTVTFSPGGTPLPAGVTLDKTTGVLSVTSSAMAGRTLSVMVMASDVTNAATIIAPETVNIQVQHVATTTSAIGAIKNKWSGKCLDVPGTYTAGTPLQQWACNGNGFDQEWQLVTVKTGKQITGQYIQAVVNEVPQSLYVMGGAKGTRLTLTSSLATAKKSGVYILFSNGLVADDAGFSKANGAHVISWPKNGGTNQHWSLP